MAYFSDEHQTSDDLTHRYAHENWSKGEAVYFAEQKTDLDSRRVQQLQARMEEEGDSTSLSATVALLVTMARYWTIKLPKSFRQPVLDSAGQPVIIDGRPQFEAHPLAGKTPPLTVEWMRKLGEPVLIDMFKDVISHYASQYMQKEGTKSAPSSAETVPGPTA